MGGGDGGGGGGVDNGGAGVKDSAPVMVGLDSRGGKWEV